MKKRPKKKMGTSKFPGYQPPPPPGADTYIPNFVKPETNKSNVSLFTVVLRTVLRGYGLIKSCLCGIFCNKKD
jgi:hypothetical protein